jgi:cyanophycin synthetase
MKILNINSITGPNVFHHRPVLIMDIDLEDLVDVASDDIEGFGERLLSLLPGLKMHHCSPGYEGGFIERLKRGTYFAHMIEHISLELSELAGIGVDYGKSIYSGSGEAYKVIVRYKSEEAMKYLLESAVELAKSVAGAIPFNIDACINHTKNLVKKNELGPSASAILAAAKKRKIPWKIINESGLIQLGHGKYRQFFQSTTTSQTSDISVDIAQDKNFTKKILEEASVRVPRGRAVYSLIEALEVMKEIPVPLAVKPLDGNHGRGVTLHVKTPEDMRGAFLQARRHSDIVIIEECLLGKDYRLIMVGGKMVAASERTPAHITGDGQLTINELIENENSNPLRGEGHELPLTKIVVDIDTMNVLQKNFLTLESRPEKNQRVFLKETANLSTGGSATDVTDNVHPDIQIMCERAARIVGLDICGVDIIAENISQPISTQVGGIIEVNAGPGIRMHHYPTVGTPRDVGAAIINNLFPNNDNGRIPIVAITGTNGKTTVSRLLSHLISGTGRCVGNTTTDGIYINSVLVAAGDTTGPVSANTVLTDPSVEIAVLEVARGGIVRRGLGYDWSDIGILTNLKLDHVGQDGIESIEDILKIKSLVVERVKPGGTVILNADCPVIVKYREEARELLATRKVIYFSLQPSNRVVIDHLEAGGHAYFLRGNQIVEALGSVESRLVNVENIPLSLGGTAHFHIANILASIAAAHAIGLEDEVLLKGLLSFSHQYNIGRTNLFRLGKGYLLLDYGHNADAIEAIGEMSKKWNIRSTTAIITAPGDRADHVITAAGIGAAWAFDKIIIREDVDLRGRVAGEISKILKEAIVEEIPSMECLVILDSHQALKKAVNDMHDNDLVVFFYEDLKDMEKVLQELDVTAISQLAPSFFKKDQPLDDSNRRGEWLQYSS